MHYCQLWMPLNYVLLWKIKTSLSGDWHCMGFEYWRFTFRKKRRPDNTIMHHF